MPKGVKGFQKGNSGGGRPKAPHTVATEKLREFVVEQVRQNASALMKAKMDLALGRYKAIVKDGEVVDAYLADPDGNAIQYLLNQAVGKPKETVEHGGDVVLKIDG